MLSLCCHLWLRPVCSRGVTPARLEPDVLPLTVLAVVDRALQWPAELVGYQLICNNHRGLRS